MFAGLLLASALAALLVAWLSQLSLSKQTSHKSLLLAHFTAPSPPHLTLATSTCPLEDHTQATPLKPPLSIRSPHTAQFHFPHARRSSTLDHINFSLVDTRWPLQRSHLAALRNTCRTRPITPTLAAIDMESAPQQQLNQQPLSPHLASTTTTPTLTATMLSSRTLSPSTPPSLAPLSVPSSPLSLAAATTPSSSSSSSSFRSLSPTMAVSAPPVQAGRSW